MTPDPVAPAVASSRSFGPTKKNQTGQQGPAIAIRTNSRRRREEPTEAELQQAEFSCSFPSFNILTQFVFLTARL